MKLPKIDIVKFFMALSLMAFIISVICFIKSWLSIYQDRRVIRQQIEQMTPAQADKVSLDLMATMVNISQTNWTVIVIPRTNK